MKNFVMEPTGLWHTHDDQYWYHIHEMYMPNDHYWMLDVYDNEDGHCGRNHSHFERADRGEIFRLARSIHDFSQVRERVAA